MWVGLCIFSNIQPVTLKYFLEERGGKYVTHPKALEKKFLAVLREFRRKREAGMEGEGKKRGPSSPTYLAAGPFKIRKKPHSSHPHQEEGAKKLRSIWMGQKQPPAQRNTPIQHSATLERCFLQ